MKRFSHVTLRFLSIAKLFSDCQTKINILLIEYSVNAKLIECKYAARVLEFSKLSNKWLFASGGVLEFWCVWNQTIIYLCDEVLTQWQLWCVIKWVDMQNVYKVCEWWIHGSQSVLHVSSQVSSFSFMCKLNKILHMRLCMEMHGCILLL